MSEYMNGTYATIKVEDGDSLSWPVVERLGNGWQSGAHYYPDSKVRAVRVLNVTPEPRTITTAEELDGLPVDSVVRTDAGNIFEKGCYPDEPDFPFWITPGMQRMFAGKMLGLPATVLWEPK